MHYGKSKRKNIANYFIFVCEERVWFISAVLKSLFLHDSYARLDLSG